MRPEELFKIEDSIEIPENNETSSEVSEQKSSEVENFDFKPYLKKEITLEDVMDILKKNNLELDDKTVNEYYEQIVFQQQEINNITENIQTSIKEKETILKELKESPQNSQLVKKLSELENKIIELSTEERIKEDDIKTIIKNISNIFEENIQLENMTQNEITQKNDNIINFKNTLFNKINENYENKTFTETNQESKNVTEETKLANELYNEPRENFNPDISENTISPNKEFIQNESVKLENSFNTESFNETLENTQNIESSNSVLENTQNIESSNSVLENTQNIESSNQIDDNKSNPDSENETLNNFSNIESENEILKTQNNIFDNNLINESEIPLDNNNIVSETISASDSESISNESLMSEDINNDQLENIANVEETYDYNAESLLSKDNENMNFSAANDYLTIIQNTQKTNDMIQGLNELIRQGFNSLSIALESMPTMAGSSDSESGYGGEPSELSSDYEDNPQIFQKNFLSDYRSSLRSNAGLETFMGYQTELKADNIGSYI